ncbi:MAG: hypothetical protein K8E24_012820, partial [Methanobacterium paludis]|nr:hypothetical protein [Methanobacterium paludis]
MLEELLIKIRSVMDGTGFTQTEAKIKNMGGLSAQALNEAQSHAGSFGQGIVDTGSKVDALKSKISQLGPEMAMAGTAGLAGLTLFYKSAVDAAASSEQVWGRFSVALGKTGLDIASVKAEYSGMVDSIQNDTGRMKGDITNALADIARVGVTNKSVMQASVESIGALTYLTQGSFGDIEQGFTKIVSKSQITEKALTTIGIRANVFDEVLKKNNLTMKDWANLTEDQRANLLNQAVAMENGKSANDAYKMSYEGIMNMIDQTWKSFLTGVGNAILPTLKQMATIGIPILQGLLGAFQGLPGPIKAIIIILPLIIFGLMAIGGAYLMMAPVIGVFKSLELATKAAAAAQWLLNLAMDANPVVLIVIAIIALIAILVYLWYTNKQF